MMMMMMINTEKIYECQARVERLMRFALIHRCIFNLLVGVGLNSANNLIHAATSPTFE
jgi:hypothetical protein